MSEPNPAEFLPDIVESMESGVYVVDCARKVLYWNSAAEAISGYRRQEIVGRACANDMLAHCGSKDEAACCEQGCPFTESLRNGRPSVRELYLRHQAGYRIPVRLKVIPLRDAHGRVVALAQVFERREAERDRCTMPALPGARDPITGLPSHEFTEAFLHIRLRALAESGEDFGVILARICELHHFQSRYGSEAAHSILRVVSQTLQNALHGGDLLGRWEEDSFLALVERHNPLSLRQLSERLQRLVELSAIPWWGLRTSVNIISREAQARAGDTVELLLARLQHEHAPDAALVEPAGKAAD